MRYELRQDSEIYALLGSLLRTCGASGRTDGTEQYIRLYGRESGSRVLYFSAQASPFLPGLCPEEQLISFLCTDGYILYGRSAVRRSCLKLICIEEPTEYAQTE